MPVSIMRAPAGGVLAVDYGHATAALYGPARMTGTLVAQQRFALFDEVLDRPGDRDTRKPGVTVPPLRPWSQPH